MAAPDAHVGQARVLDVLEAGHQKSPRTPRLPFCVCYTAARRLNSGPQAAWSFYPGRCPQPTAPFANPLAVRETLTGRDPPAMVPPLGAGCIRTVPSPVEVRMTWRTWLVVIGAGLCAGLLPACRLSVFNPKCCDRPHQPPDGPARKTAPPKKDYPPAGEEETEIRTSKLPWKGDAGGSPYHPLHPGGFPFAGREGETKPG